MAKYTFKDRYTAVELTYIFNTREEITRKTDVVSGLIAMAVEETAPDLLREITYKGQIYGQHTLVGRFKQGNNNTLEYVQGRAYEIMDAVLEAYSRLEDEYVHFERFKGLVSPHKTEA